ncbi:hypothetical protein CKO28_03200 [Rhodovibrio sodomensis]|uniref:Tyrosine specific protein phosphatases domain-containing protein n=1 Tax=Rhodovibrio sodomensis TaxID=1088 RepID=A0ABS1D9F5_9PROT|nr:hypothetical protein [Rhodovibrio sodomensis]MBK1667051.1 hypothetical protein [Rhodovibrio sodomensis]
MHSFDLRILGLDEARRAEAGAVLSLVDRAEEVDFRAGLHEIVAVADICSPAPDENETAKLDEMGLAAPTSHHAQQVIAFADRQSELLQQGSVSVVIHCFVGVSRSPAAAIGVLCRLG